jgi:hypothetical protein
MKTRTLIFTLLFLIPAASNAQIGRFIKNQVSNAANIANREAEKEAKRRTDSIAQANAERAAKETSKNIEKDINKNKKADTTEQSAEKAGMDLGKLMGGKVDLKYNEEYNFTSRLYMQTETYDKKDVLRMDLYMYFNAKSPSVGVETKSLTSGQDNSGNVTSSMVMDGENKCFIILTDMNGTKMGIISPVQDGNAAPADSKAGKKSTVPVFTKTGNTKVIAGYKCDEYTYKNSDDKTNGKVWFTKEANLNIDKRGWQQTGLSSYYGYAGFEGGLIMGSEAYNESGKLTTKSETKEINPNFAHSISVKGYSLRQMNINPK